MSITASARSVNGSLRHRVDINGRHEITTDEPTSLGGTDCGPAPHELLPAMVAACVSTMIALYARRRDWKLDDVQVNVVYDPDSTPRPVDVTVHLPAGLTADQVERLGRVAASCPVKRALEAGFTFEQQLVVDGPAADRAPRGEQARGLRTRTDARRAHGRDPVSHDR